jgi:hypothetical protein
MTIKLVATTTDLSILVQIVTTLAGIIGLFKSLSPQHQILQQILGLETFVQIVELFFYVVFIRGSQLINMAEVRYFDWFITTPTMLITSAVYYQYEAYQHEQRGETFTLGDFLQKHQKVLGVIVLLNALMLIFGYLGERQSISKLSSGLGGFVFFFYCFYLLYTRFAKHSPIGTNLFAIMFAVWNLYGVAFFLNPVWKNISFNGLDIIAKNFFGVYLFYKISVN